MGCLTNRCTGRLSDRRSDVCFQRKVEKCQEGWGSPMFSEMHYRTVQKLSGAGIEELCATPSVAENS